MKNSQNNKPLVSVVIPCLNEENFISRCLDSIIAQDYPKNKLEVLVIDGMSEDNTRKIVQDYSQKHPFIKLLDNPKKITPAAFNRGIKKAKGKYCILMGAHSFYHKNYISKTIECSEKTKAENVGSFLEILPRKETFIGQAIAYTLSSPFGAGNAYYKTTNSKELKEVDAVPFGCYRKEVFDKIGLFNEKLIRHQDFEFNSRLRKYGGKILLVPEIKSYYYAPKNIKALVKKNFQNGKWDIYTLKIAPFLQVFAFRHFVPLFFVLGIMGSIILSFWTFLGAIILGLILGSYFLINLFFSIKISIKRGIRFIVLLPLLFLLLHFSFGLGSLWGLLTLYKVQNKHNEIK